jgi:glutamyl-tRNA synthetase
MNPVNHPAQPGTVRVRFAPSPTGFLHIGGVRTALFNWLFARHHQGKYLLRIEDTDLERSEKQYTDDILASMRWLGLNWDEEPLIYQSQRLALYREKAEQLVAQGLAYRCTCTEDDLTKMREQMMAEGKKAMYDRRCRERTDIAPSEVHVIRAKTPLTGFVEFNDLIRGPIRFENKEIDDFVLIRSNGAPTYNLSVVVDDVDSRMTHIIRGDDHINNTPKQIHLYHFLNYKVPDFAHLPMILGADKKKLSKRHGAVSANWYRAEGYLPEALLNFLVRLGWSHGDQEEFSIDELIQYFDFDHVQKASGVFNIEKLLWLNGVHIRRATPERLAGIVRDDFASFFDGASLQKLNTELGHRLVHLIQPKVKLIKEMAEQLVPLCTSGVIQFDASGLKWQKNPELRAPIQEVIRAAHSNWDQKIKAAVAVGRTQANASSPWGGSLSLGAIGVTHLEIDQELRGLSEKQGVKLGDVMQPVRLALTGKSVSAGLFELIELLPWEVIGPRLSAVTTL